MTTIQIVTLSIGCLFSITGIIFIYKRIGNQESDLDMSFFGKIKTKSSGLILFLVGATLIYYSIATDLKKESLIQTKLNSKIPSKSLESRNDSIKHATINKQEGKGNIIINNPKETVHIDQHFTESDTIKKQTK